MKALYLERGRRLGWREVRAPVLQGTREALVRPLAAARCDLDAAILRGEAPFSNRLLHLLRDHLPHRLGRDALFRGLPFAAPFPFGHECVGEVVEIGEGVTTVAPGDRVVVPFQIACGECPRCRRGTTASCEAVPQAASYGLGRGEWGGVLADLVRVPFADAMLLRAPSDVPLHELASAGDNVADGVRTVAGPLRDRPEGDVLVLGGKASSVGLYAVAAAVALGAKSVTYADPSAARLANASKLGARTVDGPYRPLRPRFAITVDATASRPGLDAAIRSTEPGGVCTSVGIYFERTTPIPLLSAFMDGIELRTSRVDSRAVLPSVLSLLAEGKLRPSAVETRTASWEDAPEALFDEATKVVVVRPR